jgi:hypothetical protein
VRYFKLLALALVAFAAGVAAALAVAGWEEGSSQNAERTVAVEESEDVELEITDSGLEPDRVEVRAGVIEFRVQNAGERTHALAFETSDEEVRKTKPIPPGRAETIKIDFRAGDYEMFDPLGENRERGIEGVVRVKSRTRTRTEVERETDTELETETVTEREQRTVTERPEPRTVTETETVTTPRR